MSLDLKLVPCELSADHARIVFDWRNDPLTLKSSFHPQPKVWGPFWTEYQNKYFVDSKLPPLFAKNSIRSLGFVRLVRQSVVADAGTISIVIDPLSRGQGVGHETLVLIRSFANRAGLRVLLAEVREENAPSHRCFLKAGFVEIDRRIKVVEDTGEACPIRTYSADVSLDLKR